MSPSPRRLVFGKGRGRALGLVFLSGASACALLAGIEQPDKQPADGGPDSTFDQHTVVDDGGAPDSTTRDAGDSSPKADGTFCMSTPHAFCADWDDGGPVNANWAGGFYPPDSGVAIDDDADPPSKPGAASFHLFAPEANPSLTATIRASGPHVHLSFWGRVDVAGGGAAIAKLDLIGGPDNSEYYSLQLNMRGPSSDKVSEIYMFDAGSACSASCRYPATPFPGLPLADTWTKVDILLDLDALDAGTWTVSYHDASDTRPLVTRLAVPAQVRLSVGILSPNPSNTVTEYHIDNVVLTLDN